MSPRQTRLQVPLDKVTEAIRDFETTDIVPGLPKTPGNVGVGLLVNYPTGESLAISY